MFRYGTHYIHSAEFGGQILLENTRVAGKDADINELAENSWQEIQNAFGSGTNMNGKISIPLKFTSAGIDFNLEQTDTNNLANKINRAFLQKHTQM